MSTVQQLAEKKLVKPPKFLPGSIHYETIMGSVAYGVSSDTSDMDVYGFCIPPKDMLFPHLRGEIPGFGTKLQRFEQWQEHHIVDEDAMGGKGRTYDLSIYSIVRFFQLCLENNPNMIDSLFTPQSCILHCTQVGSMVRENRRLFLHKGAWHKFKSYAYSQMHKMSSKQPPEGNRRRIVEEFGFDVKFGYHVVRLLDEVEQILTEGDIDLQRNREQLKAIRRGEWTQDAIIEYFTRKEKELESLYTSSTLPHAPDEPQIRQLLLNCLEHHYGSLAGAVVEADAATQAFRDIQAILDRVHRNPASPLPPIETESVG